MVNIFISSYFMVWYKSRKTVPPFILPEQKKPQLRFYRLQQYFKCHRTGIFLSTVQILWKCEFLILKILSFVSLKRCHWFLSCSISYITCKTFLRVFKAIPLFMIPATNWFGQILSDLIATAAKKKPNKNETNHQNYVPEEFSCLEIGYL